MLCCAPATCLGSCRCTVCCVVHRRPVSGLVGVQSVVLCCVPVKFYSDSQQTTTAIKALLIK